MLDIVLIIIGALCIIIGMAGSVLPLLPGPPVSYAGLLLLQLSSKHPFTTAFLLVYGIITVIAALLDYLVPLYSTKRFKASKYGLCGSVIGLIMGLFFPPFGLIIGTVSGAFIGELLFGRRMKAAAMSALGSFVGFLAGTAIKLSLTVIMAYHFFVNLL